MVEPRDFEKNRPAKMWTHFAVFRDASQESGWSMIGFEALDDLYEYCPEMKTTPFFVYSRDDDYANMAKVPPPPELQHAESR